MARKSKAQTLADIHEAALRSFDRAQIAQADERRQCRDDRRFYSIPGAQWEGALGEQFANKPRFEVNKVHSAVMRIINEYRQNRITVDFQAKDGESNLDLADTCDGLYRADEQDSQAEEAYDNAFEEAAGGGFGAWRLRAAYEDEDDPDNEHQRIRFEPIYDADTSVFFDANAKRQDKRDAKECWVVYSMDRAAYEDEYADNPADWPKELAAMAFDWVTPDVVFLAEYYRVEETRETRHTYMLADGQEQTFTDAELEDADLTDAVKLRQRTVKSRRVRKYLMNGGGVLEDQGYVAGKFIPIIPVYGKRWYVDGIERCMGAVRLAKDPQRLKNMQVSMLAEVSAASGIQKPIFTPEQVAGHTTMWADDNVTNYPYLLVNPIEGPDGTPMITGPIGYTKPPDIAPALAALLQLTESDMADILGRPENGDQLMSNVSADAIEMVNSRVDLQSYIYLSNFAKAVQWCGVVWLSMAAELYVEEERRMKAVGEMGNVESVDLAKPVIDEKTGEMRLANDLSQARFDVAVDVGPSFTSRRDATVRALTGVMQATSDPATASILLSTILMNMDGEGLSEIREYFRKQLVQQGVIPPNEEEKAAMDEAAQNQQPNPQDQYLLAEAGKKMAETEESQSKTMLNVAKAEESAAETEKTRAETAQMGTGVEA
jgi:hypothetical protein